MTNIDTQIATRALTAPLSPSGSPLPVDPEQPINVPSRPLSRDDKEWLLSSVRLALQEAPHLHEHALWISQVGGESLRVTVKGEWDVSLNPRYGTPAFPYTTTLTTASLLDDPLPAITDFPQRATRLYLAGHKEAGIDLVYDSLDAMLSRSQFALIDSILMDIVPTDLPSDIIMALLVNASAASSKLQVYRQFVDKCTQTLQSRPGFDVRAIKCLLSH